MLICSAELLYTSDNIRSTRRVAKVISTFSKLFSTIDAGKTFDQHKFLQGSLFALGGLLKIEAKSFLHTMESQSWKEGGSSLVCPLSNPDNELDENEKVHIREMSEEDVKFF
mmetsp:Transcript_6748/g.11318  ORF Transcript_6748/g.11318 Transcript_6748/m.11318 type:complete len:112 (+) Transcript_6748:584-919(+)